MTTIAGYIYNARGQVITTGALTLTLQRDMTLGTAKIAPFTITVNLAQQTPAGYVSVALYPTDGATPTGLVYTVEFDPDPADLSMPKRAKAGYWVNYWSVPDAVGIVPIGAFPRRTLLA